MKTKTLRLMAISSIAMLLGSCMPTINGGNKTTNTPTTSEVPVINPTTTITTPTNPDGEQDYYASINDSMTGDELKHALYAIIHPGKAVTDYDYMWTYIMYSDSMHPESEDRSGSSDITAFYQGTVGERDKMNKEHVWPDSRGGNFIEGDPHMVRPTFKDDNTSRGNSFYVEGKKSSSSGWDPAADGMNETYRGDCARIIFYCAVQEMNHLTLVDKENDSASANTMGKLSDLLKWNLQYAVQQREMNRNDILNGKMTSHGHSFADYHLCRNPFIDHPEYACRIWGGTNATTKSICGM